MVSSTSARRLKSAAVATGGLLALLGLAACGSQPNAAGGAPVPAGGATTPVSKPSTGGGTDPAKPIAATTQATSAILGPNGYGKLKLGMSVAQAKATGLLGKKKFADSCDGYDLAAHPTPADSVGLYFSKQHGLVAIFAQDKMITAQGIKLGTTMKHVRAVFPKAESGPNGLQIAVPGNKSAYYSIIPTNDTKTVGELALATTNQDCFG